MLPDGTSSFLDGFVDFALHKHEATRMVARYLPQFATFIDTSTHDGVTDDSSRHCLFQVVMLEVDEDHRILNGKENEKMLLGAGYIGDGDDRRYYTLYLKKARAQPFYQVHFP